MGEEIGFVTSRTSTIRTDMAVGFLSSPCPAIACLLLRRLRRLVRAAGHPRLTVSRRERRGWPGHRLAEATPSFGRLCPAMTTFLVAALKVRTGPCRENTAPPGRGLFLLRG